MTGNTWIINRRSDLLLIFGGAIISLLVILPTALWPALIPVIYWTWALCFDGTHLWATYSRTLVDSRFIKSNSQVVGISFFWFFLPLLMVGLNQAHPMPNVFGLFLLFMLIWTYHHIVRQHYGFVSLYDRKQQRNEQRHQVNKYVLYVGLWTPYLALLINHPINQRTLSASNQPFALPGWLGLTLWAIPITISVVALLVLWLQLHRDHYRAKSDWLNLACLLTYSFIYYIVAPFTPVYSDTLKPAEYFMVVSVMTAVFHNIQYHAIVWMFNRKTYYADSQQTPMAKFMNANVYRYIGFGLLFSAIYVAFEWWMGEFPSVFGSAPTNPLPWALAIWWGFSLQHYYLDQKIWRTSKSNELQSKLIRDSKN